MSIYFKYLIHQRESKVKTYIESFDTFHNFEKYYGPQGGMMALSILTSFGLKPGEDKLRDYYLKGEINRLPIKRRLIEIPVSERATHSVIIPTFELDNVPLFSWAPELSDQNWNRGGSGRFFLDPEKYGYKARTIVFNLQPSDFSFELIQFLTSFVHENAIDSEYEKQQFKRTPRILYQHLGEAIIGASILAGSPLVHLSADRVTNYAAHTVRKA